MLYRIAVSLGIIALISPLEEIIIIAVICSLVKWFKKNNNKGEGQ